MAFKQIGNSELTPMIKPKLLKKGQTITGYYVGQWSGEKYPDAKSIVLVLTEDFVGETSKKVDGKEVVEPLTIKAGQKAMLNASGTLKFFMNDQDLNYLYQFKYKGMVTIKKGPAAGKDTHDFEILKDDEATYDAGGADGAQDDLPF